LDFLIKPTQILLDFGQTNPIIVNSEDM